MRRAQVNRHINYYFLRIVVPEKVVCSELVASQARGPLARTKKAKIARSLSMFLINQEEEMPLSSIR